MVIATVIGLACIASSAAGVLFDKIDNRFKTRLIRSMRDYDVRVTRDDKSVSVAKVRKFEQKEYGFYAEVELPSGYPVSKFEKCLEGLEQSTASKIKFRHKFGRICSLKFGRIPLYDEMKFHEGLLDFRKPLSIPFFTHFGVQRLDFRDEASCHLLDGGASRMGKTVFLRLIATILMMQTNGDIQIIFIDNKVTDLYMFRNIHQITIAEDEKETAKALVDVWKETLRRKSILKEKGDVIDLKEYRKKYPNEPMPPIVVIIDEYGRFAESELIQEMVTAIAETAGYLDIHLIIAAQRPDAREVLNPRIKANLLPRIAFSTADEANSNIILGIPDAYKLGNVPGRAILVDGTPSVVQVPYISTSQTKALLRQYYRSEQHEQSRRENTQTPETLPGFVTGSIGDIDMPGSSESDKDDQSGNEPFGKGLFGDGLSATEGPTSLHAEPTDDQGEYQTFPWPSGNIYPFKSAEDIRGRAGNKRNLSTGRLRKNPPANYH